MKLVLDLDEGELYHYNQYHDKYGKFSTGPGGISGIIRKNPSKKYTKYKKREKSPESEEVSSEPLTKKEEKKLYKAERKIEKAETKAAKENMKQQKSEAKAAKEAYKQEQKEDKQLKKEQKEQQKQNNKNISPDKATKIYSMNKKIIDDGEKSINKVIDTMSNNNYVFNATKDLNRKYNNMSTNDLRKIVERGNVENEYYKMRENRAKYSTGRRVARSAVTVATAGATIAVGAYFIKKVMEHV